jgi:hypothetical protein
MITVLPSGRLCTTTHSGAAFPSDWVLQDFDRWMAMKYGQRGTPGGNGRLMYRCPCHDDTHRSLSARVWNGKLDLKCFAGCPVDRVEQTIGYTQNRYRPIPPEVMIESDTSGQTGRRVDLREGRRILTMLWERFEAEMQSLFPARTREYLLQRRIPYRTGRIVPSEGLWSVLVRELPDTERLVHCGFAIPDREPITPCMALRPKRIIIPYFREGRVIAIKSRTLATDSSRLRYCGLPGWGSHVYIADAPPNSVVLVVEGELKALIIRYYAHLPCVAVPGVQNAHRELVQLCHERGLYPILLFDTEPWKAAVSAAAQELSLRLSRANVPHRILWLPLEPGSIRTAPDDYLLEHGAQRFIAALLDLLNRYQEDATPPNPEDAIQPIQPPMDRGTTLLHKSSR